jgi:hypothetical protein
LTGIANMLILENAGKTGQSVKQIEKLRRIVESCGVEAVTGGQGIFSKEKGKMLWAIRSG